jgi:hypothetical protein
MTTGKPGCFWIFEVERRAALAGRAGNPLPAEAADGAPSDAPYQKTAF